MHSSSVADSNVHQPHKSLASIRRLDKDGHTHHKNHDPFPILDKALLMGILFFCID